MPKTVSNTPSVYSFLRIADDASIPDNARVTMDGNSPKAVSHITFQSTNQRAMQTFLRSIAYEFGQGVADIATRELRNAITTSSPLTAGNVRNVKSLLERNIHSCRWTASCMASIRPQGGSIAAAVSPPSSSAIAPLSNRHWGPPSPPR